jgi:hypothetical protein
MSGALAGFFADGGDATGLLRELVRLTVSCDWYAFDPPSHPAVALAGKTRYFVKYLSSPGTSEAELVAQFPLFFQSIVDALLIQRHPYVLPLAGWSLAHPTAQFNPFILTPTTPLDPLDKLLPTLDRPFRLKLLYAITRLLHFLSTLQIETGPIILHHIFLSQNPFCLKLGYLTFSPATGPRGWPAYVDLWRQLLDDDQTVFSCSSFDDVLALFDHSAFPGVDVSDVAAECDTFAAKCPDFFKHGQLLPADFVSILETGPPKWTIK